jgi:hypothetical protein
MKKQSSASKKQSPAGRARELLSELNDIYEAEVLSGESEEEYSNLKQQDAVSLESLSDEMVDEEVVDVDEEYEDYCVECTPVAPDTFAGTRLSPKGRCCQICQFEGCGVQQSHVVTCKAH